MLEVGQAAPAFSVMNDAKQRVELADLLRDQNLLLVFIHGTWCPHCVQTIYRLRRTNNIFASAGVGIAVLAIDAPEALHIFRQSAEPAIPFPLLADEDEAVHHAYDLPHLNAYFVIDQAAVVRAVFPDKDHHSYPGHTAIIQALRPASSMGSTES